MRILDVIASVNPMDGGPIESVKQRGAFASEYGTPLEVLSLDDPEEPWAAEFPGTLHALGPTRLSSRWLPYRYAPGLVPWLERHAGRYDAVVVHGLWQYHAFGTWLALRRAAIPYFVFTHGMLDPWFKRTYPLKHIKKWLYWPWADYRVLRDARSVLFTCEEERVLARQSFWLYRARETVVGFGTTAASGDADAQRERFLSEFPALRGKRNLLFLSRLHPKKGCDALIAAFARVARRDLSLRLVMAGPDNVGWRRELEAQAAALEVSDRVTWTGMLSGDVKWGAYRAADAFVLPSHQENFGIVVAEALACGLPVLISDKVNIWREIRSAECGIVANDDIEGTVAMLETWLDTDEAGRQKMRKNAVECFARHFDIRSSARRLLDLVQAAQRIRAAA